MTVFAAVSRKPASSLAFGPSVGGLHRLRIGPLIDLPAVLMHSADINHILFENLPKRVEKTANLVARFYCRKYFGPLAGQHDDLRQAKLRQRLYQAPAFTVF